MLYDLYIAMKSATADQRWEAVYARKSQKMATDDSGLPNSYS